MNLMVVGAYERGKTSLLQHKPGGELSQKREW